MSGALDHSPAEILAKLLIDNSLATDPADAGSWPAAFAQMQNTPDNAISIKGTESDLQNRSMIDGEQFERYGLSILVRGTDFETGEDKARDIAVALDGYVLKIVAIGSTTYRLHNISRSGGVLNLGEEQGSSRFLFSINVLLNADKL